MPVRAARKRKNKNLETLNNEALIDQNNDKYQ